MGKGVEGKKEESQTNNLEKEESGCDAWNLQKEDGKS